MYKVLIVEDDPMVAMINEQYIKRNKNFEIVGKCNNGLSALDFLENNAVDLLILDVYMPKMDGFEFTSTLRQSGCNIPILMISAKQSPIDKRKGFIIGTDDYMTKPVDEEEMVLRIGALLRRSKIVSERKLTVGSTTLYFDSLSVVCGDDTQELPQKEFLVLFKLLSYPGKIFTRRQLMDEIWDMDSESDERTVDVHVSRLRDRYRNCPDFEIVTVRGLGYKAVHIK